MNDNTSIDPSQEFLNSSNTKYRELFFSVTAFTKILTLILFIAVTFLGFWAGLQYGEINSEVTESIVENNTVKIDNETKSTPSKPIYSFRNDQDKSLFASGGLYEMIDDKWQWNDGEYAQISCQKKDNSCTYVYGNEISELNVSVLAIEEWGEKYVVASGRAGYCWPNQEKDCEIDDYVFVADLYSGDTYLTQSNMAWEQTFLFADDLKVSNFPSEIQSKILSRLFPSCVAKDKVDVSFFESLQENQCSSKAQLSSQEISTILTNADICQPRDGLEVRWLKTNILNPSRPLTTECTWLVTGRVVTYDDEGNKDLRTQVIYIDDTTGRMINEGIVKSQVKSLY